MPETAPSSAEKRHPIQVAARRSGVNLELLRAWERRYAVVSPGRQQGGRRLYSDDDVTRLGLVRRAVQGGLRIKDASSYSDDQLQDFLRSNEAPALGAEPSVARNRVVTPSVAAMVEDCRAAVLSHDAAALERAIDRARVALSVPELLDDVVSPLLTWIGEAWSEGGLRIYQEHRTTVVLREFLASLIVASRAALATVVVTTPAGQVHELGALMAAAGAAAAGWRVEYLGPDLPAAEIAAAADRSEARAIVLSIVVTPLDGRLADELRLLRRLIGPNVAIFVGGRAAGAGGFAAPDIDARVLSSAGQIAKELGRLPI